MTPYSSNSIVSTLVLYDWEGVLDRLKWLELSADFFRLVGEVPNFAEYGTLQRKLRKTKPASLPKIFAINDVGSCTIECLLPPYVDVEKWNVSCDFFEYPDDRTRTGFFSHVSDVIDGDLFVGLVQRFNELAKITYGHAYLRPVRLGPAMYANDLIYGLDEASPDDRADGDQMTLWFHERLDMIAQNKPAPFRHLSGLQRDVYPFNVLTRRHLDRQIAGQPLEKWITDDSVRGLLEQVAEGLWVWIVSPQSLAVVQEDLAEAGLLITRAPHNTR